MAGPGTDATSRPLKIYLRWQYSVENSLKMLIYNT